MVTDNAETWLCSDYSPGRDNFFLFSNLRFSSFLFLIPSHFFFQHGKVTGKKMCMVRRAD